MTKSIVLTELSELARYRDEFANDTPAVEAAPQTPVVPPDADPDALVQAISRAARELQRLADTDAAARREAEDVLANYRRLQADADSLRKLISEARSVSAGAARLGENAFVPESRAESEQLAVSAAAVETIASKRLEALTAQIAELEQRQDLARLLAEERSLEETRQREEQALAAIERAEALASGQKFNEALRLLGSAVKLNPNMPGLASSYDTIARRAHAVKTLEVESALAEARRSSAVNRLGQPRSLGRSTWRRCPPSSSATCTAAGSTPAAGSDSPTQFTTVPAVDGVRSSCQTVMGGSRWSHPSGSPAGVPAGRSQRRRSRAPGRWRRQRPRRGPSERPARFWEFMHDTDSIRRDHPIADVVAASGLQLRPMGGRLTGVCPFHGDTRPSLIVYPASQSYYCFGCGAGGDVIDFVARLNKVGFKHAVELLCGTAVQPYNLSSIRCVSGALAVDPVDAARVVDAAVDFYHGALWRTPKALGYLRSRGVREATIHDCRLGFGAPGLSTHLVTSGVDPGLAESLGLLKGKRECFAGRIIIPDIIDRRATWLTGRRLDEQEPRYLNLRTEKPILGLDRVKGDSVVLVEGPFDWLTAVGWGFDTAALLGTRMSERVLRQLDRFTQVYLALDNDDAGQAAMRDLAEVLGPRAIPVHLPPGVSDVSAVAQEGGRPAFISCILRAASDAHARGTQCVPAAGRAA